MDEILHYSLAGIIHKLENNPLLGHRQRTCIVNYALSKDKLDVNALTQVHEAFDCELENAIVSMNLDNRQTQKVLTISNEGDNLQSIEFYDYMRKEIVSATTIDDKALDKLLSDQQECFAGTPKSDDVINLAKQRSTSQNTFSVHKFMVAARTHPFIKDESRSLLDFANADENENITENFLYDLFKFEYSRYIIGVFKSSNIGKALELAEQLFQLNSLITNRKIYRQIQKIDLTDETATAAFLDYHLKSFKDKLDIKREKSDQGEQD